MKALRDAALAGATLALLLYVAMTAAKSMADTQSMPSTNTILVCKAGVSAPSAHCSAPMQVARRDR